MSYPYNNNYNWSNPNPPSWIPQHPAAPVPANQVPQVPPPMPFPSNQSQNNVTFKIRFVSDVRRLTLNASIGFKQLEDQIRDLFGDKELFSTHSIKYKDDEGDWVTMSSDLELKEAMRLIDNKRLIQLSIEPKNSAVQQVSDALHQMHKDPQLLQSLIQSLTNSRISSPLSASSTPQAGSTSSFPSSPFTPSTPLYSAVNNANKPVDSPSTNNEKKDFAPVVLPQSQSNQSQVWCDGCGVKLLHQSHKCSQCPDYDLCDICYQKRANTKVHHHDSFYNRRLDWGKVPEEKPQTSPAVQVQPPMFSPPSQPPQLFSPPSQPQFSPQQPPVSPFKPNAPVVQPLSPVAPTVEEKAPVPPVAPFPSQPVQTFFAVQPQLPPQPVQPPQPVSEVKSTYKHSARCDVCMKQIIGVRFKCRGCDDFDLCENCFPTRTHTNAHSFDSLTGPEKANRAPAPVEPIATTTLDSNNAWGNLPQVSPPAVPAQEAREVKEENNNNNNQPVELPPSAPQMDRKTIEDGMKQLHDMGFHDRNQNLQALIKSGGNVVAAITSLLN